MRVRGLVDGTGALTNAGRATKEQVERVTDDLAATAYAGLSDAEVAELVEALRPVAAAVVAAGEIPTRSPMGLDLAESAEAAAGRG